MVSERPVHRSHGAGHGSWLELWPRHGEGSRQEQGRILGQGEPTPVTRKEIGTRAKEEKNSHLVWEITQVQRVGCRSHCADRGNRGPKLQTRRGPIVELHQAKEGIGAPIVVLPAPRG